MARDPAVAQMTWVGGTGSTATDWTVPGNWSPAGPPTSSTFTTINTMTNAPVLDNATGQTERLWIGQAANSSGSLTIQNNAMLTTNGAGFLVGWASGASGSVKIQDGGTLITNSFARIGWFNGTVKSTVTVTGQGSSWTISDPTNIYGLVIGGSGTNLLSIEDRASVAVTTGSFVIGRQSSIKSTLEVRSGGTLSTLEGRIGGSEISDTTPTSSTAIVTGTGPGGIPSLWSVNGNLFVGYGAAGTLTIEDSGKLTVAGDTTVANGASSKGTLNINTNGVLETGRLVRGSGDAQVNFNGGILHANASDPNGFITGFSGTELNIEAPGGLTIDSNGFDIGTDSTSAFTGQGGLTKTGDGALYLAAENTYQGGTTIEQGTLAIGFGGTTGSIEGDVTVEQNGTLQFLRTDNITFDGEIKGDGNVEQDGGGTLTLTGDSSQFMGTTTISSGTLQIGDGGADGSLGGDIVNNDALVFDRTGTLTVAGNISGSGTITQAGPGTTVLTGNNSGYSGEIFLNAGTLSVSADNNLGTGGLTFNGGTLKVTGTSFTDLGSRPVTWGANGGGFDIADADNVFSVSQTLGPSTGGLTKIGAGTLVLTADNTYSGPTTIEDGTLQVNGSIASPTTVERAGTLGGTGTIFNNVFNSGTVAPGPLAAGFGMLTIDGGTYEGDGGTLRIRTALGDDTSSTDQLVINNGSATGSTGVRVVNQGGAGAVTSIGIPIIVAEGTTMMDSTAFSLSGPVVAGLYQYRLFQGTPDGSGTPQQEQSWYLRNTTPGPDPQPLTRPEGPLYGLMPGIARALNVSTVGTFHERNGDQQLLRDNGRGWGRLFGHHREQGFTGTLSERFKGNAGGLQAGIDFTRWQQPDGSEQRTGVFFAFAMAKGDAHGLALATPDRFVGDLRLSATSVGAYWTHIAPTGAYLDAVLMGSAYDGSGNSTNSIGITVDGWGATASLEAGLPIQLGGGFMIEPQAQIIWQSLSLDGKDAFTSVDYGVPSAWQGRLGVRLAGSFAPWGWTNVRPYLKASFVADWADEHSTTFAGLQRIRTGQEVNLAEVGAGFTAQFTPTVGVWGTLDYSTDISGGRESREIWRANAGLRVTW